jgi:hypothetical protein
MNCITFDCILPVFRREWNSADADPTKGVVPEPLLVLHMERGKILNASDLPNTPAWAKPLVATAPRLSLG